MQAIRQAVVEWLPAVRQQNPRRRISKLTLSLARKGVQATSKIDFPSSKSSSRPTYSADGLLMAGSRQAYPSQARPDADLTAAQCQLVQHKRGLTYPKLIRILKILSGSVH